MMHNIDAYRILLYDEKRAFITKIVSYIQTDTILLFLNAHVHAHVYSTCACIRVVHVHASILCIMYKMYMHTMYVYLSLP